MIIGKQNEWFYLQTWKRNRREEEMKEKWNKEVSRLVEHYKNMEAAIPGSSILREVRFQYRHMAKGGDGGDLGFEEGGKSTCREVNYPNHPTWVFQKVVAEMGWS